MIGNVVLDKARKIDLKLPAPDEFSYQVFLDRYADKDENGNPVESTFDEMHRRVANAIGHDPYERELFFEELSNWRIVPGGRIMAGAGLGDKATMGNCYVLPLEDSRHGIFRVTLGDAIEILSKGGGVGFNFSSLRPKGAYLKTSRGHASGPVSFIDCYNKNFETIEQGGSRRAAAMGIMNADHPDILEFIDFKADNPGSWQHLNVSLGIVPGFVDTLQKGLDTPWTLQWNGKYQKTLAVGDIWERLVTNAWRCGDPGIFNIAEVNRVNNTYYWENLQASNPCGEIPLPPYGVCVLSSVNLSRFVNLDGLEPVFDFDALARSTRIAIRFLDGVLDANYFPIRETQQVALQSRRVGLSVMGLADVFILMGVRYGDDDSLALYRQILETIRDNAYQSSIELARERGAFPMFDPEKYLNGGFVRTLPKEIRTDIARYGIRNACCLTQAPTGTTSILAGTTSGIEPVFARSYIRRDRTGKHKVVHPNADTPAFVTAHEVPVLGHLRMQKVAQQYIDQSVSKTINCAHDAGIGDIDFIFRYALTNNFKGITVFRDRSRDGVLEVSSNGNNSGALENKGDFCPECGGSLTYAEHCKICLGCGWSACTM